MKRIAIVCASACFLCAAASKAEVLLTPRLSSYELEGVRFSQLAFSDGAKEVNYSPPAGWDTSGSASKLVLRPKDKAQAEGSVTRYPLPSPTTFDEPTMKKLAAQALASVPAGSINVELVSQEKNPVVIEQKETFAVTMSYAFYGESYKRFVMFMNRGEEQFCFQFGARSAEFDALQRAFLASQFSWQGL